MLSVVDLEAQVQVHAAAQINDHVLRKHVLVRFLEHFQNPVYNQVTNRLSIHRNSLHHWDDLLTYHAAFNFIEKLQDNQKRKVYAAVLDSDRRARLDFNHQVHVLPCVLGQESSLRRRFGNFGQLAARLDPHSDVFELADYGLRFSDKATKRILTDHYDCAIRSDVDHSNGHRLRVYERQLD